MRKSDYIGMVYINDPTDDGGAVYSRGIDGEASFPRDLGTWEVRKRYISRGTPMISLNVTLNDGTVGQGKMRSDRPGYVYLYPAAT